MDHPDNWIPHTGRPIGGPTVVLDLDGVISDDIKTDNVRILQSTLQHLKQTTDNKDLELTISRVYFNQLVISGEAQCK